LADVKNQVISVKLALRRYEQGKMNEVQVLIFVARAMKRFEEIFKEYK